MTAIQPCEMSRELKLRIALAKLLPDDIEITDLVNFRWRRGPFAGEMIRDTEWDFIVRRAVISNEYAYFCEPWWLHEAEQILERRGIEWDK